MALSNKKGKEIAPAKSKYARSLKKQGQDAMRERIKGQQHINQILKNVKKLQDLDEDLDSTQVTRLKVACDQHFKILGKILPDIKQTEINVSGSVEHKKVEEMSIMDLEKIVYEAEYEVIPREEADEED